MTVHRMIKRYVKDQEKQEQRIESEQQRLLTGGGDYKGTTISFCLENWK